MKKVSLWPLVPTILLLTTNVCAQEFLFTETEVPALVANSPIGGQSDDFGRAVDIDGAFMVASAPNSDVLSGNTGSVVVYEDIAGVWTEMQVLNASDAESGDLFGRSVAISGTTIVVGCLSDNLGTSQSVGSIYVFELQAGSWVETAIIYASDPEAYDFFGHSLAIDGDVLVAGAIDDDDVGFSSGSIYIFERTAGVWNEIDKKTASDGNWYDYFGFSVDISDSTIVVGAYFDDPPSGFNSGSAYIFECTGGVWNQVQKIEAPDQTSNDQYGFSVAINGDKIAIGAPFDDDFGSNSGSIYAYKRAGATWAYLGKVNASDGNVNDNFGHSLDMNGSMMVVGAKGEDANGTGAGAVYVYENIGGIWTENDKMISSDGAAGDEFGYDVAISSNYIAAGSRLDDESGFNSGSAYVFEFTGATWDENSKLVYSDQIDNPSGDFHGVDVSIDRNWAFVGAYGDDDFGQFSGSVYIYERIGADWELNTKFTPSDATEGDNFGFGVDVSGDLAIIGAYGDDDNGSFSGSAYILQNQSGTWTEIQKLTANDGVVFDYYGFAVAIDDNNAVVGAYLDDDQGSGSGSAYFYEYNGATFDFRTKVSAFDGIPNQQFGYSVALEDDKAVIGARFDDDDGFYSGSVYVYEFSSGNWNYATKLTASNGSGSSYFGTSVAMDGGDIAVGAPGNGTPSLPSRGAAYVFEPIGSTWNQAAILTDTLTNAYAFLGTSVAIENDKILAGAYRGNVGSLALGVVNLFVDSSGTWEFSKEITAADGLADDYFGISVDYSNGVALIGGQQNDDTGKDAGSAYFFEECIDFDQDGICDFQQTSIPNDECADAIDMPLTEFGSNSWTAASLYGATGFASSCIGDADDDIWFKFTANSANDVIEVIDVNGTADLCVEVFDGCGGNSIGCFNNYAANQVEACLVGTLLPGTTYYYKVYDAVSGVQSSQSVFTQVKTFAPTSIRSVYCGVTDYQLADVIQASRQDLGELYQNTTLPIKDYSFKLENSSLSYVSQISGLPISFQGQLAQFSNVQMGTSYDASAKHSIEVHVNGTYPGSGFPTEIWSEYGESCAIETDATAPPGSIIPTYCNGSQDYDLSSPLVSTPVPGATQYRFTFDDGVNQLIKVRPTYHLLLYTVPGIEYAKTYTVTVEVFAGGAWSPPGPPCILATKIAPPNVTVNLGCGTTIDYSSGSLLLADVAYGYQSYQWKFEDPNTGDVFLKLTSNYALFLYYASLPGLQATTYDVSVRARAGGVWGDFSGSCQISLDNIPPVIGPMEDVSFTSKSLDSEKLHLQPNPAVRGEELLVNIELPKGLNESVKLNIVDVNGRLVQQELIPTSGKSFTKVLTLDPSLSPGMYTVTLHSNQSVQTHKLMILK